MAVKPVKFISDILAKRRILKTDSDDNVLFSVSGSLSDGCVSSSLPITASSIWVEGDLVISGSPMPALNITASNYNVNAVFQTINNKFTNLQLLSEQQTGSFDINGFANIQLNNFSFSDLDYVMVDVMVKVGSSTTWKNDLISVELSGNISTNKLHVLIDAPALTNTDYFRIFANKHTESL